MQRIITTPRPNWTKKVEEVGFFYHSLNAIYWDERAYYSFTMDEILKLERATSELYDMCLKAAQYVIDNDLYDKLAIPREYIPLIVDSWNNESPAIYGRFDLQYDGVHPPKMLEFNADTPTSLLEAGVVQWYWMQDLDPKLDQFNSIHEKLIAYWGYLKPYLLSDTVHFTGMRDSVEDFVTVQYLRDTAEQAGLKTFFLDIATLGWNAEAQEWRGEEDEPIKNLFKLYPWEWLVREANGPHLLEAPEKTLWIEPAFKMLLSNKGILPILWKLYPYHSNLLPAFFEDDREKNSLTEYARKPLLSREGSNIQLVGAGITTESSGDYGAEGYIIQGLAKLPDFSGNYPVIGSWIIGQEPAGMGIRESDGLITGNTSRFVPHVIQG